MHVVTPDIIIVSSTRDINLDRVNKFTLTNTGTADVEFGFNDQMVLLRQGQSTGFESGANAWFSKNAILKLRFTGSDLDSKECTVMICKVDKPSNIFQDVLK